MVAEELDERPWLLHRSYKPSRWRITEYQRRLLLEQYDGRSETIDALMRHFSGVPRWRVKKWAAEMGLSNQKAPPWTPEELDYLTEHLGVMRVQKIAKHLGRTTTAVFVKSKRLGISRRLSEGYTMRGLCEGLGVDHHKVEKWLEHGWLRGTRLGTARSEWQGDVWHFTDRAVYELVRDHPAEIDPRRVEWHWLVDIMTSHGGRIMA